MYAPKRFPGGVIRYGEIESLNEMVTDEKSHFSPKEIYLPIVQTTFFFRNNDCIESEIDDEKIVIYARACDIEAASRLDTIFLSNGNQEDLYYKRLRDKVEFRLIECKESFENCFCKSMGIDGASENKKYVSLPDAPVMDESFWEKFNDKCISCGGCSAVCPTCSCFDTIDVIYSETSTDGERRRIWGSCMREDFGMMAGGHNVRKTPGERLRFRVMHKMYDFKERFGKSHMCVGCGRCADRCPNEISIIDILSEIAEGGKAK